MRAPTDSHALSDELIESFTEYVVDIVFHVKFPALESHDLQRFCLLQKCYVVCCVNMVVLYSVSAIFFRGVDVEQIVEDPSISRYCCRLFSRSHLGLCLVFGRHP